MAEQRPTTSGSSLPETPDVDLEVPRPTPEEFREQGLCGVERFKDASCGYQGCETWCDRSRTRCRDLGNLERFDGAMPDITEPYAWKRWDTVVGLILFGVFLWGPHWGVAGTLYAIFLPLLLPPVKEELYWRYLHRPSAEQDDVQRTQDQGD